MKKVWKKVMVYFISFAIFLEMIPVMPVNAEDFKTMLDISKGYITIGDGTVDGYDSSGNKVTTANPNGYIIIGKTNVYSARVTGGSIAITLRNMEINYNNTYNRCAISISSGANVNFKLEGTNRLAGGQLWAGLEVPFGASVTITGENPDTDILYADGYQGAGIGAGSGFYDSSSSCGNVTISGGCVIAGDMNSNSAGIGGSRGTVIINGGKVNATGGNHGAGIGGDNAKVIINNGNITAKGRQYGAGIGGSNAEVNIKGGNVDAKGGEYGAGIGGVWNSGGGNISISGGTVIANGGTTGAGIGGGFGYGNGCGNGCGNGGNIKISGGNVIANGKSGGAGIGGGEAIGSGAGAGGNVTISGGTVQAYGENGGAGIGGGAGGGAGNTVITGGSVKASSISGTPTNGADIPKQVYLTTVTLPDVNTKTAVSSISVSQGSILTYGIKDIQTDDNGKLFLYLPEYIDGNTSADVTLIEGVQPSHYYGKVNSTNKPNFLKMNQKNLSISNLKNSYIYGDSITPNVTGGSGSGAIAVAYTGTNSITGEEYSSNVAPVDVGNYLVKATKGEGNSYYEQSITSPITINPKDVSNYNVILNKNLYEYLGAPIEPVITVRDTDNNIVEKTNYNISYINNNAPAMATDLNKPTVRVTFKGNYTATIDKYFNIEAAPTILVSGTTDEWTTSIPFSITATAGYSNIKSVTVTDSNNMMSDITSTFAHGTYSYTATHNDTYTFTVTSNSGFSVQKTVSTNKIDNKMPSVTVTGITTRLVQSETLTVNALTGASGVKKITVVKDNDNANEELITNGQYIVKSNGRYVFTVVSNAGTTATQTVDIRNIDTAKPIIKINSNGYAAGSWTKQNVKLDIANVTENLGTTTCEYKTDTTNWEVFHGNITLSNEGITNLRFRATSESGVVSDIKNFTVKIDKISPTNMKIDFSTNPFKSVAHFLTFGLFFNNTVNVNFSAEDSNSSVDYYEYQVIPINEAFDENGIWKSGELSITPDFKGTIYARTVDKAGNISGYIAKSLVVDKKAPVITVDKALKTTDRNAVIPVTIEDTSAGIGKVSYQINGGEIKNIDLTTIEYSELTTNYTFSIGSLPDGIYDVLINAQDNAGNSAASTIVHVNKDTRPYVTAITITPNEIVANHGSKQLFSVSINGINNPSTAVYWSVSGNKSIGTAIDKKGILTIADDESSAILIITATSIESPAQSVHAMVTVKIGRVEPAIKTPSAAVDMIGIGMQTSSKPTSGESILSGNLKDTKSDIGVSPANIVPNIAAVPVKINSICKDNTTGIIVDTSDAFFPAGVTSVSLKCVPVSRLDDGNSAYSSITKGINANKNFSKLIGLQVYDITLLDQNGNSVQCCNGKLRVELPVSSEETDNLHIFWFNPTNKNIEDMNGFKKNGYLVFETTHLSIYAIAKVEKVQINSNVDMYIPMKIIALFCCISVVIVGGTAVIKKRGQNNKGK